MSLHTKECPPTYAIMELPEAAALVDQLEFRLSTLDHILSKATDDAPEKDTRKIEISEEQLDNIKDISSNVNGLLKCFNDYIIKKKGKLHTSESSEIPADLLLKMNSEKTAPGRTSATYIVQMFGGITLEKPKPKGLRNFASQVLHGNVFSKSLRDVTSSRQQEGDYLYLPTEFKRLDLDKKVQLARMLSLENLKMWGYDAFEVENITHQDRFVGGLDESDTLQVVRRGCPVVMIGWAVLASPYAQVR